MLKRYRELAARIDGFFDRVAARHGADMACRAGCSACCHQRLTITAVEAAALRVWASGLDPARRAAIAAAAAGAAPDRCSALDDAGRCRIYDARPIVCRSHGVPVRLKSPRGLPVVESCELNFRARGPAAAAPDCILDQELVSTVLGLLEREYLASRGRAERDERDEGAAAAPAGPATPPPRLDLADVLRGLAAP